MRGAFPPVDFRAVCLVRAIFSHLRDQRRSSPGPWAESPPGAPPRRGRWPPPPPPPLMTQAAPSRAAASPGRGSAGRSHFPLRGRRGTPRRGLGVNAGKQAEGTGVAEAALPTKPGRPLGLPRRPHRRLPATAGPGASGRRHSRELTQSRSLGPSLRPTRRWERSNKSRSRRAEREDAPPTNDQTALRSKPPDASIFIETLHAASVRHRTLICIHQRLFRLAGAFADALTSPHTKAVLRGRFLIGRGLGH